MPDPIPTGADLVRLVICSLNGGYNGLDPNQRLGITPREDGTVAYSLTSEDGTVQAFTVTIEPDPPTEP